MQVDSRMIWEREICIADTYLFDSHVWISLAVWLWVICALFGGHCTDIGWRKMIYGQTKLKVLVWVTLNPPTPYQQSHKALSTGWLPSARTVDIVGSTFFLAPFILNNICVLVAGAYARSNLYVAEVLTRILYVLWFLHCFSLAMAVLFSGIRLVRILNRHLAKVQSSGPRYTSIKTGIFKVR